MFIRIEFNDGQWKVVKGKFVIARGWKRCTLYVVEINDSKVNFVEEGDKTSTLCHQHLGNMSEKGMKILASKGSIPKLKKVTTDFREPCVTRKQKKVTFLKSDHLPKAGNLELIHSNVYGPTLVSIVEGARYDIMFNDDCTRKVWVYFLKQKSEVFNKFNR